MSNNTAINRFIVSSVERFRGFYQQLTVSRLSLEQLGSGLTKCAEYARSFRQIEQVKEVGQLLANLPSNQYRTVGHYYLGWAMYRNGQYEQARGLLEQVAERATSNYQARALLSLGTIEAMKQDTTSESYYYIESFKASGNLLTRLEALRGLAVIKAKEGFHQSAVKDFERFLTLAEKGGSLTFNIFISSLAVELAQIRRIEEARNICKVVLASPFAFAYPEWRQTAEDLRGANRSFVAINPTTYQPLNVLTLPVIRQGSVEVSQQASQQQGPAKVFNLQRWKKKMGKEPNGDKKNHKSPDEMTEREIFLRVMELFSNTKIPESKRRRMLEAVEKAASEPDED